MTAAKIPQRRTGLRAALATEWLKLRRGTVIRLSTALLVAFVPVFSIGAVALARAPQLPGVAAAKFAPYATGDLARTHLLVLGQILSVTVLLAGGFASAWAFGREFSAGTVGAMAGLPVGRGTIAATKGLVLGVWLAGCVTASVPVTLVASIAVGGQLSSEAWTTAGVAWVAGLLGVALSLPFGWAATITRSQLGTVGILIAVVMVTQIVVVLGGGGWFPWAIPSLLSGMGGAEAAVIAPGALLLTVAVGPLALVAVGWLWHRLDDT